MGQKALALAKRRYSTETLSLNLIETGEVVLALLDGNNSTENILYLDLYKEWKWKCISNSNEK